MNSQLTSFPTCGFIAQLVEHRTGIADLTGSNPVEALNIFFFQASLFRLLKLEIHCDDRLSRSAGLVLLIFPQLLINNNLCSILVVYH